MQQKPRITWTNRLTYILTVAGATVGFGATWRFPYMVSTNGGGAYVLMFLIAMFAVGVPIILVENVIGRRAGCDAFSAFARAKDGHVPHPAWRIVGASSLVGSFLIMAFYMVLGAWVIAYIYQILLGVFGAGVDLSRPLSSAAAAAMYDESIKNSPWMICAFTLVFVLLNYFILRRGLIDGIERSVKFLMPLLFLSLLALIARNLTLPGSFEGVKFYLMPDFSKLNARLFLDVLGQVFFALSLGFGVMITLSSHLSRGENMPKTGFITGALNSLIAVLAGFMIFPALSALDPNFSASTLTQGPTLVFVTLPAVFSHMHFGALFAVVFFALLLIAALTTTLPIYQVIISALIERWGFSQQRAIVLTLAVIFVLGNLPSIFSERAFGMFDFLSGNIFFTLTALGCVLFVGFSLGKNRAISEISNGGKLRSGWLNLWFFYVRWVLPVVILAIFLSGLLL